MLQSKLSLYMKHTPVTDKYLDIIDFSLRNISSFEKESIGGWNNKEIFFELYQKNENDLYSIDFNEIKREFWETCNDFDKIIPLKHVFQIKFEKLFNSRVCSIDDFGEYFDEYEEEAELFITRSIECGEVYTEKDRSEINRLYISIISELAVLKKNMYDLLNEWHQMGINSTQKEESSSFPSKFKLSNNKKTDFIKIISAMYDNRMFETKDGYLASNKQELMNELGHLFGEDLSKYSVLLSKSKNPEKDVFLKPFKDIEKKAEEYYDKES